jgi:membrane protein YqaA with SNARE-associated domain
MAMLGFIGFIALGFTVFGVIAGGVLGVIMGRYAGKRIKRHLTRKRNKVVELDIVEIKLRSYIKWVKI